MLLLKEMYLDSNAHLPLDPQSIKIYLDFINSKAGHGHPSSFSQPGREAAAAMETARDKIAELIGAKNSHQIVFTSTCTSACTWGLQILNNIDSLTNYNFYLSPTEHPAVKESFKSIFNNYNELQINKNGKVIDQQLPENSKVACVHVQNELGLIQPLELIKSKYLFSDMSQSLGKISINISEMNIDIAAFAGHKFGGGMIGFLYLKDSSYWQSFDQGSRYFMDRAGTPDVANVVVTAEALKNAIKTLPERSKNMINFRNILETGLENRGFEIIAKEENRSPNTTFAKTPKSGQGIELILKLAEKNIHIGLGSACNSLYSSGNPLMDKLGRPSNGHDYIRISQFGGYNEKDANYFLNKLDEYFKDM